MSTRNLVLPFCLLFFSFFGGKNANAKDKMANSKSYYVAPTGDDSRSAKEASNPATPWKTIQKAASSIAGGETVIIAGGIYHEKVSVPVSCNGDEKKVTLFKAKEGDSVIVDGDNGGKIWQGFFSLKQNKFITLKGIRVQNSYWYGFDIIDCDHITIDGCSTYNTGASGIYCNKGTLINALNNNIRKACQRPYREPNGNGTQECITFAGINNFIIKGNEIWDSKVPNIAGGEGIDTKGGSHDGEINGNYVHDILLLGIYVDAGSREGYNIKVCNNKLIRTAGLGVAGELGGYAHDIYFYNNLLVESIGSSLVLQSTGNGKFTNIYVVNNTFYNSAHKGFAGEIGSYSKNTENANIIIKNNIFYNKVANARFSIWHNVAPAHQLSNNLYFDFKPSNNGTNSYKVSNLTATDIQEDPQFKEVDKNDFSLKSSSPAIKKGIPIMITGSNSLLFSTDINGKQRGKTNWNMGAYE